MAIAIVMTEVHPHLSVYVRLLSKFVKLVTTRGTPYYRPTSDQTLEIRFSAKTPSVVWW